MIPEEDRNEEAKEFFQKWYLGMLTDHLNPELQNDLKKIQEGYQDSIKTLAKIDPLTAYYLSGRSNVFKIFESIQEFIEDIKRQFPDEQHIKNGGEQIMSKVKPDILQDAFSDLEKDIRNVAWKINPFTWYRSVRAINSLKANVDESFDKKIDQLFEEFDSIINNKNEQQYSGVHEG